MTSFAYISPCPFTLLHLLPTVFNTFNVFAHRLKVSCNCQCFNQCLNDLFSEKSFIVDVQYGLSNALKTAFRLSRL